MSQVQSEQPNQHELWWGDLNLTASYGYTPRYYFTPVVEAEQTDDGAFVITTLEESPCPEA